MTSTAEPPRTPIDTRTAGLGHEPAGRALAAARVALGLVFLRAFPDKVFGLGYSTRSEGALV
ncbi:hypothetical protein [Kitasatospora phosalacinea]|uniref:hypothetical protein n=1 Tax=Kitasatospora phosalacinea TaxID=2065 RepID=UPI00068D2CE5